MLKILPLIFYIAGSILFLAGSVLSLYNSWPQKPPSEVLKSVRQSQKRPALIVYPKKIIFFIN